jgi:hypothetical protein
MTTDPTAEPLRFAYWVPNVSGGLVTSTIEQRTDWSFAYNRKLACPLGVDLILTGFLHYHEEVERFGRDVLPIVRELEVAAGLDRAAIPDPLVGLSEDDLVLSVAG